MEEEGSPGAPSLPAIESRVAHFWERTGLPKRLLNGTPDGPPFRFTEGPPTANGRPHLGHLVARAIKDCLLRYHRMRGDRIVSSMAGWDCHGLPVELEVEKRHGIKSKKEIEAYGVEDFCEECRDGALEVEQVWRAMSRRLGYWLDYENAYRTMDPPYMESVWWALAELYRRDLLGPGYYSLPYCPRCETPLSSHEVAQGYRDATDPSVVVRFELVGEPAGPKRYLLVWTTTPWTLPSNLLIAARADLGYVGLRGEDGSELVLTEGSLERFFPGPPPTVVRRYSGREFEGLRYRPLFPFAGPGEKRYRVVLDDSVDPKEGTGFVHIAPSFGPEDQRIGEREEVGFFDPLDGRGVFTDKVPPVASKPFKAADPVLLELLARSGALERSATITHTYPFCWRCDTALIYRAVDAWFVRTRRFGEALVRNNRTVHWVPEHLRDGRFGNFLSEAKDWALSRNRYWGTPLPIWSCPNGHREVFGSFAELGRRAGGLPERFDPHRTTVDAIRFPCARCDREMVREPYTIDGWFDSGCAPFAQYHYPFEPGPFDPAEPLDAIAEGLDQTRGWFYVLLVLSTALFDRPAYRASIVNGLVLDDRGQKMSKSRGNALDPLLLLESLGGDTLRWAILTSDYTEPMRLGEATLRTGGRRTLVTLYNAFQFFRQNALDRPVAPRPAPKGLLDRWLLDRLDRTSAEVRGALESLEFRSGALALQALVADLSLWYLRRSRPRFWSEELTEDRLDAHATLGHTLLTIARLLAPYAPFLSEELYQELTGAEFAHADRSVHAEPFPLPGPGEPDLAAPMEELRRWVEVARELRQRAGVKSRVPLATLVLRLGAEAPVRALGAEGLALLRDELNVGEVRLELPGSPREHPEPDWVGRVEPDGTGAFLSARPTEEERREGLVREALRRLQNARKEAGLGYAERIELEIWAGGPLGEALRASSTRLERELLAVGPELREGPPPEGDGVLRFRFDDGEFAARIRRRPDPAAP